MNSVRLIGRYAWLSLLPLRSSWIASLAVALLPAVAYAVLGNGDSTSSAQMAIGYSLFVALSTTMTSTAFATAGERVWSFDFWTRSFPSPSYPRLIGRAMGIYAMMLVTLVPMLVVIAVTTSQAMSTVGLALAATLLGAVLFSAIGLVVGTFLNYESISAVASVLIFLLATFGGIVSGGFRPEWMPQELFDWMPPAVIIHLVTDPNWLDLARYLLWAGVLIAVVAVANRRQTMRQY